MPYLLPRSTLATFSFQTQFALLAMNLLPTSYVYMLVLLSNLLVMMSVYVALHSSKFHMTVVV